MPQAQNRRWWHMNISRKWQVRLPQAFDPAQFEDPVAQKTSWTLLRKKGSSGGTYGLEDLAAGEFRILSKIQSSLSPVFYGFLALMAAGVIFLTDLPALLTFKSYLVFSLIILLLLGGSIRQHFHYLIFDVSSGKVSLSIEIAIRRGYERKVSEVLQISDIHAIQLLEKDCQGSDGFEHTWVEINLVLADGSRFHVSNCDIKVVGKTCGANLAEALQKPLWDATA